ncbi:MAG: sporulation protein YqfD [Clostridia bacterium]|nr:sporulation protein YqfD [Clostridia bacterium]
MLLRLIRFFRGYVTFIITGRFPERFINLAMKNGIAVFDPMPEKGYIKGSMIVSDYRCVRKIAKASSVKLRIISRHGLPFFIHKFRHRFGLLVGVALFLILTLLLQGYVWTIEVNGVKTLSETQLITALESSGLKEGAFKGTLDLHKIERKILLDFEQIGWMSINLLGTHAEIEIKEKALVPQREYGSEYSNIKASKDGIILSTNVRRGTVEVKSGSAVSQGQLLVGGISENKLGDIHFVDADADIVAETSYSFLSTMDEVAIYNAVQESAYRSAVSFFRIELPVTFYPKRDSDVSNVSCNKLYLFDSPTPVCVFTEEIIPIKTEKRILTEKEAKERLETELALYKLFNLQQTSSIKAETQITKTGKTYEIKSEIKCTEDIGVKENLIVNTE